MERENERETERRDISLASLLIKTLIPSTQGHTLMTSFNLTYVLLQKQPHWELGLRHMNLGDISIRSIIRSFLVGGSFS